VIKLLNERIDIACSSQISNANKFSISELSLHLVCVFESLHDMSDRVSDHSQNIMVGTHFEEQKISCLSQMFACIIWILIVSAKEVFVEKPGCYDIHVFVLTLTTFVYFEMPIQ